MKVKTSQRFEHETDFGSIFTGGTGKQNVDLKITERHQLMIFSSAYLMAQTLAHQKLPDNHEFVAN